MTQQNTTTQAQQPDLEYFQELFDLGKSLVANNDYDKGIAKLQKSLKILQESGMMDDPLATNVMEAIGNGYRSRAEASADPITSLNDAIKEMRITLPAKHLAVNAEMIKVLSGVEQHTHIKISELLANAVNTLAASAAINDTLIVQEIRYTVTLNLLHQAINELKAGLLGNEHPVLDGLSNNLANVCNYLHVQIAPYYYAEGGDATKGLALYDSLYVSMNSAFPKGHDMIGVYAGNLGWGYTKVNQYAEAAKFYEHSLSLINAGTLANKDAVAAQITSFMTSNNELLANITKPMELVVTEPVVTSNTTVATPADINDIIANDALLREDEVQLIYKEEYIKVEGVVEEAGSDNMAIEPSADRL